MSATDTELTATKAPAKPGTLRYALILGGLSAFGPLSIDMYLPALPQMTGALHSTNGTLQLTLTGFIIGLALGQLIIGPLSDALGRRRPLLTGLGLYAVASVLCAVSPSAEMLIAARLLQAVGAAAGIVIARAIVRDLYSGTAMTKFFSMMMLVSGLGPILAPVLGGQILRLISWRGVFVVLTVFGVLLLITAALALPEPLPAERRRPARLGATLRTYGNLLADRSFFGYAFAGGLMFAGLFAYVSASSFVLQDVYGLSPQGFSLVFGANGVGIVLAGQINGRLVGRFPERRLLATGLVVSALGGLGVLLAALFTLPLVALLVPLLLLVSSIGLVMPNASSLALAEHPHNAGSASALLGVMQFVVGGFATPLVSIGGESSAVPMGTVMAGFAVAALVIFATMTRARQDRLPAAAAR
ncbi:Bcr/CflA family multidrug efflux MFS transporter [Amycolatopsis acidicola]|uniref:Bcr/CflA family multidrug efflux MFS transporter n=1 Tax=Amycolatopsis acidicola TaxID=2596893 RepID=A0A5N0VHD1_9PSEU|nr:Bcr/CflA family multidrug efflux MFS transporter [Amycolatopsis acidicola]KAA9165777.1 Bcr/CflA family multidrug efflux MFS transporter [Amycolatopsis acidicola]